MEQVVGDSVGVTVAAASASTKSSEKTITEVSTKQTHMEGVRTQFKIFRFFLEQQTFFKDIFYVVE